MTDTILVLGGAGFVGSHCCKALAAQGFVPVTFDSLENGAEAAVRWGPLEVGDLGDGLRLAQVLLRHRPRAVIHCAAFIEAGQSVTEPLRFYHNNLAKTLTLLEAMQATGVGLLVFSSTAAVYGAPDLVPIPEEHPLRPTTPYGRSKVMVEQILADMNRAWGLRSVALRYFNAAGADPAGDLAERHHPETHLIPLAIRAAYGWGPGLRVFGDDYTTPDGTCIRDYVHVSDLAEAHGLALRWLLDGGETLTVNLGCGRGASVREVIDCVGRVVGRPVPVTPAPRRAGDPPVLVADPSRAHAVLGWHPRYPDLIDQVTHAARALAAHGIGPRDSRE